MDQWRAKCPDGGYCHHQCSGEDACFRVQCCGPLSGVYPDDKWPADIKARHSENVINIEVPEIPPVVWPALAEKIAGNARRYEVVFMFVTPDEQTGACITADVFAHSPTDAICQAFDEKKATFPKGIDLKHTNVYEKILVLQS